MTEPCKELCVRESALLCENECSYAELARAHEELLDRWDEAYDRIKTQFDFNATNGNIVYAGGLECALSILDDCMPD